MFWIISPKLLELFHTRTISQLWISAVKWHFNVNYRRPYWVVTLAEASCAYTTDKQCMWKERAENRVSESRPLSGRARIQSNRSERNRALRAHRARSYPQAWNWTLLASSWALHSSVHSCIGPHAYTVLTADAEVFMLSLIHIWRCRRRG